MRRQPSMVGTPRGLSRSSSAVWWKLMGDAGSSGGDASEVEQQLRGIADEEAAVRARMERRHVGAHAIRRTPGYLCDVVEHARILTLCSIGLQHVDGHRWRLGVGGIDMPNLEELQLLMSRVDYDVVLEFVSSFFAVIRRPVLQRLFVRLPSEGRSSSGAERSGENDDADMILEDEIVLDQLTFIKIVNFRGTWYELRLLRFFLKSAPALRQLVLVTPEGQGAPVDDQLKVIHERVSALKKASSEAGISVCRPKDDDSLNHPHTTFFHEEYANYYAHTRGWRWSCQ